MEMCVCGVCVCVCVHKAYAYDAIMMSSLTHLPVRFIFLLTPISEEHIRYITYDTCT